MCTNDLDGLSEIDPPNALLQMPPVDLNTNDDTLAQLPLQPPTPRRSQFPYTIVTASSANHLCSLENFLYSLHDLRSQIPEDEFPRVVVYNIGMNRTQLPVLDQLKDHGLMDELELFDYFQYPRFWDVAINAGEYAWKTGIVNEARLKYGGTLVWLDAGNKVTANFLRNIPTTIQQSGGFWSPRSQYTMGRWTHKGMFDYYGIQPQDYARNINCNGAAIGFDASNQTIVDNIIVPWFECGMNKNCIAPAGSSRLNHRQDQAALTLLVYRSGHHCALPPGRFFGLQIHRDVACRSELLDRQVRDALHRPSSIDFPKWYRSDTLELYNHPEWRYPEREVPNHIQTWNHPPAQ
ncbi:hypothetical protein DM01DRAFT_1334423 [Hesseltinella vesiculosa]|uniref:Uncharacterized protein n=1 Tax=Hesseltinella vesiculosa TaxID=101127 RepID=A0A1X2GN80_9FUNG|nr:hypothetical protein DM01DRAFT_1334423 [Hesseltinella vesiculosa]